MKRMESLQPYDFAGIEQRLRQRAREGWLLKEKGAIFWTYEAIPPQDLQFSIVYTPQVSTYEPRLNDSHQSLYGFCEMAGWRPIAQWNQLQIFVSEDPDPAPLENDDNLRLSAIHKTMMKTYVPGLLILIFLYWYKFSYRMDYFQNGLAPLIDDPVNRAVILAFLLALSYFAYQILTYLLWHRKANAAITRGEPCPPAGKGYRYVGRAVIALLAAVVIYFLHVSGGGLQTPVLLVLCIILAALIFLGPEVIKLKLKKNGVSRRTNMLLTNLSPLALTGLFLLIAVPLVFLFLLFTVS